MYSMKLVSFGQTYHYVTSISWKSLIYQTFSGVNIILVSIFWPWLSLYNDLIIVDIHLSKINNFMFLKPSQTSHFRFIVGRPSTWPIRLSLYNEEITIQTLLHKNTFSDDKQCTIRSPYLIFNQLKIQPSHSLQEQRSCLYMLHKFMFFLIILSTLHNGCK